jgi:DNA adenine methylase
LRKNDTLTQDTNYVALAWQHLGLVGHLAGCLSFLDRSDQTTQNHGRVRDEMSLCRPLLRYHGGKWQSGKWIVSHFPSHQIYVEPFGGAASVLLQKSRAYAEVYNDVDAEVVNLFRVLRDEKQRSKLLELLYLTPFAREEFDEAYTPAEDAVERALRLIVRSFMGFSSGGVNANRKTGFRGRSFRPGAPSPAMDWMNYPESLAQIIERLRGVCIENQDVFQLIPKLDTPQTLYYLDPPYLESTRACYGMYCHEFTEAKHIELCEMVQTLQGMVVISGYYSELYKNLYKDWHCVTRKVLCDGHGEREECLWLSPSVTNQSCQRNILELCL